MSDAAELIIPKTDQPLPPQRGTDRRVARFPAAWAGEERRLSKDRRANRFQRWRKVVLGGMPVAVVDRRKSATAMVDHALERHGLWRYPAYLTSANGEVAYRCATDSVQRALFLEADAIHADGMPHVFASRVKCELALPERVATTDLFYDVATEASARGATMYLLGATASSNARAVDKVTQRFPKLKLVGARHGFFADDAEELATCRAIAQLAPDILWVSMGVPHEQKFVVRNRHRLTSVGVIKTSGGLFDFLSEINPRAPAWMQRTGFEWLWRVIIEPKRLAWRYLKTSPLAIYLLLTQSR